MRAQTINTVDLERYPLYRVAERQRMELILEPGDALYIPALWWHAVESLDTTVSVNFWWRSMI